MSRKKYLEIYALVIFVVLLAVFMANLIGDDVNAGDTGNGNPKITIVYGSDNIFYVDPGEEADVVIRIENNGSGDDNFYVNYSWNQKKDWILEPMWNNKSLGEIKKDRTRDFSLTVSPNDDPAVDAGEKFIMKVEVFTRYQGEKKNITSQYFIFICNQVYKVGVEVDDDFKDADPGDTVTFYLTNTNEGNGEDTFSFSLDDSTSLEDGWTISLPTTCTLERDKSKITHIRFKVSMDASSGEHWYNVIVSSSGDSKKYDGIQLTINVSEVYNFIVTAKDGDNQINVDPDETATFSATFENTGNDEDEYNLEVDDSNKPEGWSYTLNQDNTPTISGGKLRNLTNFLSVTAPSDYEKAPANSFWLTTINATSDTYPKIKKTAVFKTVINQVFDVEVSANESAKWVDEGGTIYYNFLITNNGNGEETIKVEITGDKAEWGDLNTPASVVLKRKRSGENIAYANVSVSVPEGTLTSSTGYCLNLTVTSENGKEKSNAKVRIKVKQNFDIRLEVIGSTLKYENPGDTTTFKIRVTNKGNGEDEIKFKVEPSDWDWEYYYDVKKIIKPDSYNDINFKITIPKNTKMGTYNITITAISTKDESPNPVNTSVKITIKVNQTYEVSLSFPKNSKKVNTDNSTTFDLTVTNDGNGKDKIILDTENLPSGWTRKFSQREVWLNASESKNLTLTISVPKDAAMKNFYLNVTATSSGKSSIFTKYKIIVSVNQSYDFTLDKIPSTKFANPGDTVKFEITIKNEGKGEDRIDVDCEQKPNYWIVDNLSPITISNDCSVKKYLNITVPDNATKNLFNKLLI